MPNDAPPNQPMFHGGTRAAALADQLPVRFNYRQHHAHIQVQGETALVQIGAKHGTPETVQVAGPEGGILVTMGRDRTWLVRVADSSRLAVRAFWKDNLILFRDVSVDNSV